jgi:site-specific DNA-methyltransferase (adenine-specific)
LDFHRSSDYQAIAAIPEPEFDDLVRRSISEGKLNTNRVLKFAAEKKREAARERKRADLLTKSADAPPSDLWRVIEGDCLPLMRAMQPGCARQIFADPPYNQGVDYGRGRKADRLPELEYLDWCQEWMGAAERLLTDDGSLWVLISKEYADDFGVILRRQLGLHRRDWVVWYESFGVNCANKFNRCSRHLFYMVKDPKRFVFRKEAVNRASDRQAKYRDKRAAPGGKIWDDIWGIEPEIPRVAGTHGERLPDVPTQLPVELLLPIVGCASDPGDLVLDPFNGSGTTGEACIRLGRRYTGIEIEAPYCEVSRKRLAAAQGESHAQRRG